MSGNARKRFAEGVPVTVAKCDLRLDVLVLDLIFRIFQ